MMPAVSSSSSIMLCIRLFVFLLSVTSRSTTTTTTLASTMDDLPPLTKFTANMDNPKVLNVHVVPHTHDDVGWLKTVEQYFYGLNNTIQQAHVQAILDTTVDALAANVNRTFTYVEQRFFSMWWFGLDKSIKDQRQQQVKDLIANGQLNFANGGWCMHDEATTHFIGMIDQTTTGHTFLKSQFNYIPKVGWQLDPFGHSSTQATLMTSKLGMDALYFGRIDYQDLAKRKLTKETEGLWQGSNVEHLKDDTTVFWGLTGSYSGNYGPPKGFGHHQSDEMQFMTPQDQQRRITDMLLPELATQALQTKGNHIMLTMGTDFDYEKATAAFASVDLMVQVTNHLVRDNDDDDKRAQLMSGYFGDLGYESLNVFYSSPEYYTQAKFQMSSHGAAADAAVVVAPSSNNNGNNTNNNSDIVVEYTVKTDDFLPYASGKDNYWTGFFVSRAGFKRMERLASSILMAARQIEALVPPGDDDNAAADNDCDCGLSTFALEDAVGVSQHHDAITGTAKQHVAFDYAKRVQAGIDKAMILVLDKLKKMFVLSDESDNTSSFWQDLTYCQLLNETKCPISQLATTDDGDTKKDVYVIVYNPLAQEQSTVIRLPVGSNTSAYLVSQVGGREEEESPSKVQAVRVEEYEKIPGEGQEPADYYINFYTGPLPPVGAALYKITVADTIPNDPDDDVSSDDESLSTVKNDNGQVISASNGLITVHFNESSGEVTEIEAEDGTLVNVKQTWGYYTSAPYASGAYVFRPMATGNETTVFEPIPLQSSILETGDAIEAHVHYKGGWVHQVTRLSKGNTFLEVEYVVGPIPIGDHKGKEVVTRYDASQSIDNDKVCYTDANGREFRRRVYNHRESWDLEVNQPVAGNFYSVNTAIYIQDNNAALSIATDRTQGGACLDNGVIEIMVQRRNLYDDGKGLGEPLNETTLGMTPYPPFGKAERRGTGIVVKGKHRLSVGKGNHGASLSRSVMDLAYAEPLIFVASAAQGETPKFRAPQVSALKETLPKNVMLVSFLRRRSDLFLVRLAHQYSPGEDANQLSEAVEVDLSLLFKDYSIKSVSEATLSANQDYQAWVDRRKDWTGSGTLPPPFNVDDASDKAATVTILPMDIRTFHIEVVLLSNGNGNDSNTEPRPPPPVVVPVPESTSTVSPTRSPAATKAQHPTNAHHSPTPQSPHHSQTHKSSPVSSTGNEQESAPSRVLVYVTIAGVALAAFFLYRRHRRGQRAYDQVVAGEQTFDMELSTYQPGLT